MVNITNKTDIQTASPVLQRASAKDRIRRYAERIRNQMIKGATPAEIAAWPNKAERARRYRAGTASDADTAVLTAEVNARNLGETIAELAQTQLAKEAYYSKVVALIDGLTRRGLDAIDAATDDQIDATLRTIQGEAEAALQQL